MAIQIYDICIILPPYGRFFAFLVCISVAMFSKCKNPQLFCCSIHLPQASSRIIPPPQIPALPAASLPPENLPSAFTSPPAMTAKPPFLTSVSHGDFQPTSPPGHEPPPSEIGGKNSRPYLRETNGVFISP